MTSEISRVPSGTLRQELMSRISRLGELRAMRDSLNVEIAQLELTEQVLSVLAAVSDKSSDKLLSHGRIFREKPAPPGSAPDSASPDSGSRPMLMRKGQAPLWYFALQVLEGHPDGLALQQICDGVLAKGYKTAAGRRVFLNSIRRGMMRSGKVVALECGRHTLRKYLESSGFKPQTKKSYPETAVETIMRLLQERPHTTPEIVKEFRRSGRPGRGAADRALYDLFHAGRITRAKHGKTSTYSLPK